MVEKIQIQNTIFDLDTFGEVTLVKEVDYSPVESTEQALAAVGNDTKKLLEVINDGLRAEMRRRERSVPNGWHTFTDEGEVNGPWAGTPADPKKVNALVLTLAKTVFGFSADLDKAGKKAAKESAMGMIQSTPAIRDGLKKSAALAAAEPDAAAE